MFFFLHLNPFKIRKASSIEFLVFSFYTTREISKINDALFKIFIKFFLINYKLKNYKEQHLDLETIYQN